MCVLGVAVAVVFMIVPVGASFGNDPLLRLRQLDPQLSPPAATAVCGSPVSHLTVTPHDASLYNVARTNACQDAARRRFATAIALGALIVVFGLLGMAAPSRLDRPPGSPRTPDVSRAHADVTAAPGGITSA